MPVSNKERLKRFYACFSGDDHVLIVINADPDAIASAMAVKRLLWRRVMQTAIAHVNVIKRPDNLAMIRLLALNMTPLQQTDIARFTRFVLVDSQPSHHEAFAELPFHVVIDHHPETAQTPKTFADIRPRFGATSTIMTEYLRAAGVKPSARLATALFYGIKTDTNNFVRQTLIEDVRAFQFLFRLANMHLVRRFEYTDLSLDFLKYFQKALAERRIRRGRLYVHLGPIPNPDICVILADFFMRIRSIGWSLVSGTYDKKLIIILRNDGIHKNAGKTALQSFGRLGSAGGHKSMARTEIELKHIEPLLEGTNDTALLNWIIHRVETCSERGNHCSTGETPGKPTLKQGGSR